LSNGFQTARPAGTNTEQPVEFSTVRSLVAMYSGYSRRPLTGKSSAEAVIDDLAWQRLQWVGDRSLAGRVR
jgi:hypothetical protein